jgi:hypothetical protein
MFEKKIKKKIKKKRKFKKSIKKIKRARRARSPRRYVHVTMKIFDFGVEFFWGYIKVHMGLLFYL